MVGASSGIGEPVWTWSVLDRTREGNTLSDPNGGTAIATQISGGTTTIVADTTFAYTTAKPGYLLVGDVIRLQSGQTAEVTAVEAGGAGSDKQRVTIRKISSTGADWVSGDLTSGDKFGHSHNMFAEGSSAPQYRLYLPTEETNTLTILSRALKITGSELTNRTIIGDGSAWYFTQEELELKEFAKDREMAITFGQYENGSSKKSTKGIWDYVWGSGVKNGFASSAGVSEEIIQDHIKEMMLQNCSNEITVFAGADFMVDFQRAMKHYVVSGGTNLGGFRDQLVGLDVTQYYFLGKNIYLKYYELFDDTAILPYTGTPSSTAVKFSNASLWLDLGTDGSGVKLINMKHKEHDGMSRKFIHAYSTGMVSPTGGFGGQTSNLDDAFTVRYLSEIGVEVRLANRHGILYANS